MYQILFTFGPFQFLGHTWGPFHFYSYGFCMALAFGVSITLFARDVGKQAPARLGLTYEQGFQKVFDLATWVILCSLIGARLFYVLENHDEFTGAWLDAFKIWQGGLVFYGGLFGALLAGFFWLRHEKWPLSFFYDLVAPYILLGHAIGRIGCFLNGCCYGNIDPHYGLIFPSVGDNEPHLPTQLWEMAGDFILFLLLLWVRQWTLRYPWLTFSLYGLTYGTLRFVIEFWRRDWDKRYLWVFNSASQAVSGIIVALSVVVIVAILLHVRKKIGTS